MTWAALEEAALLKGKFNFFFFKQLKRLFASTSDILGTLSRVVRTAHSQCMPGQLPLSKTTALAGMLRDAKKVMRPGWE